MPINKVLEGLQGPGGIKPMMDIAFPLMLSTSTVAMMMFIDRLYLKQVSAEAMNAFKLKDLVQKLLPECTELLKKHHSAGADAHLHRKLAYALYGLGRAPCRLLGTAHRKRMLTTGEDNEIAECILCGERF